MRTYYRGPDALLTDDHFIWRTPSSTRMFAVRELRDVTLVRGEPTGSSVAGLAATAAGLVTLTVASWSIAGPAAGYVAAAVAALIASIVVAARSSRSARRWSLQGTYRGMPVLLYSSPDPRVFNQVTRALRRAIEDTGPTQPARGLAVV
ncbi:DUF6232 family protein [Nucisporomicrobium flavum]|jgi:Family of unknown function (DUF6232)|uniref:DUF6232 family protein n=1 Tax=Nucisporomicrobium flavum TaxID=2785915 RepID=UPI003C2B1500